MNKMFSMPYRVIYADTDQMGVVYYANYLVFFERVRDEMLRQLGIPYSEMEHLGFMLPVSEAYCKYLNSAHFDDLLTLSCAITEVRGARLKVYEEVRRGDEKLAEGFVTLVCINNDRKVVRVPQLLLDKCSTYRIEQEP